jgi:hypothetical protein
MLKRASRTSAIRSPTGAPPEDLLYHIRRAHFFYGDADGPAGAEARGLAFPGRAEPDYWDFLYFPFVIGMTFQASDVQIENHRLHRIGLAHGVLAFFFNVAVLALTINGACSSLMICLPYFRSSPRMIVWSQIQPGATLLFSGDDRSRTL